jgi:hypothetical protein
MSAAITGYNYPTDMRGVPIAPAAPAAAFNLPMMTPQQAAYMATLQHAEEVIKSKESGALGSYKFKPDQVRFSTQNPREQVFVLLRAHAITNIGWVFRTVVWMLMPFIVIIALDFLNLDFSSILGLRTLNSELSLNRVAIVILISYYSLLLTSAITNFINWYYNLYLVTNERIIDYNFQALISYEIVEARLENIEDVKEKSVGFLPSLWGYGDIFVQTAGKDTVFDFISVPQPSRVRDIIADLASFSKRVYGSFR